MWPCLASRQSLRGFRARPTRHSKEFRVVLEYDPYRPPAALAICWRIDPNIDTLLRVMSCRRFPASIRRSLTYLISKKETAALPTVSGPPWHRLGEEPVRTTLSAQSTCAIFW